MDIYAYHKTKCSKEEVNKFKSVVLDFLKKENLPFKKAIALTAYGGEVRVYTGEKEHQLRQRMGRKLVAFKNPDGTIQGCDQEAIDMLKNGNGNQIWQTTNEPIEKIEFFPVYKHDWEENPKDEMDYLREQLKRNN